MPSNRTQRPPLSSFMSRLSKRKDIIQGGAIDSLDDGGLPRKGKVARHLKSRILKSVLRDGERVGDEAYQDANVVYYAPVE